MRHLDEHLDEGTIHAWLDGALSADEAARVRRHVATCAECAAQVAEARGFVAGASRILSALDDAPAVVPTTWAEGRGRRGASELERLRPPPSAHRRLWSRPGVLAAAASVVVVLGTALIVQEGGEPTSRAAGSMTPVQPQNTEASADLTAPAVGGAAPGPVSSEASGRDEVGGVAGASSPKQPSAATRRMAARTLGDGRAAAEPAPAARRRLDEPQAAAENAVAQKTVPAAPPAPAPPAAADKARPLAPSRTLQLQEVVVTAAGADTSAARRSEAARGAAARRAGAAEAPSPRAARVGGAQAYGDTIYTRGRIDTIAVGEQRGLNLRGDASAAPVARALPVTGCYEIVEGGLPKVVTLTADRVWSGAAEHAFVATTEGAVGYWSQPSTGNVHLVIARAVIKARVDAATGELRGKVQRGRKVETFVARRCK
jgi:anti-sigma factor RsiW